MDKAIIHMVLQEWRKYHPRAIDHVHESDQVMHMFWDERSKQLLHLTTGIPMEFLSNPDLKYKDLWGNSGDAWKELYSACFSDFYGEFKFPNEDADWAGYLKERVSFRPGDSRQYYCLHVPVSEDYPHAQGLFDMVKNCPLIMYPKTFQEWKEDEIVIFCATNRSMGVISSIGSLFRLPFTADLEMDDNDTPCNFSRHNPLYLVCDITRDGFKAPAIPEQSWKTILSIIDHSFGYGTTELPLTIIASLAYTFAKLEEQNAD